MDLQALIGQLFFERELFDLLQFEIESNFARLGDLQCHVYFERTVEGKIRITEIKHFTSGNEMNICEKAMIEKCEWFHLNSEVYWYCLYLVRFDRSGWHSKIKKDTTRTMDWALAWADEYPSVGEPTAEELRQGLLELTGLFESDMVSSTAKSKRAAH